MYQALERQLYVSKESGARLTIRTGDQPEGKQTMIAHKNHTNSTNSSAADHAEISGSGRVVRSDSECRARASEFLTELIGSPPDDLQWDDTHHLQGHGHLDGHELVVIAPRDDLHQTVVLTAEDWDAVSRASIDQRRDLLATCAIADHNRLVAVLRDHQVSRSFTCAA